MLELPLDQKEKRREIDQRNNLQEQPLEQIESAGVVELFRKLLGTLPFAGEMGD